MEISATSTSAQAADQRQDNKTGSAQQQSKGKETLQQSESEMRDSKTEGVALPPNLAKAIRRRSSSSVIGSTSGGSGNNSDNSGIVSIGNNSFGFNFDSEEGKTNESDSGEDTSPPSQKQKTDITADSAHGSETSEEGRQKPQAMTVVTSSSEADTSKKGAESSSGSDWKSSVSSLTQSSSLDANNNKTDKISHHAAAAAVVANLHSIATQHLPSERSNEAVTKPPPAKNPAQPSMTSKSLPPFTRKRAAATSDDQDSGGYNSEADESTAETVQRGGGRSKKKAKKLDDSKREERNAREKERSFRISKQINELRSLLSSGGVIVPKGTKSSVLTEAANYIRMLQQHQYRSEIDRHQLVQQMQMIGGGALGPQASNAVRHVAAQNGVWSLGNFGGVPPKSAMTYYKGTQEAAPDETPSQSADAPITATVQEHDYRFIFNSSPVGMAIASMGGAFIDCNSLFCQLSNYSKQEVCSMTIFNLTSRQDLQHAFDLISQMISPPTEGAANQKPAPCVLRGSMKNRDDLGLSVGLIRGDDGIAKCFCVTLIKNPTSPFDTSGPTPATADLIGAPTAKSTMSSAPAYTAG